MGPSVSSLQPCVRGRVHACRDQRISQDVDKLATSFGDVLVAVIITPLTIIYYTYNLSRILGFLGPVSIYGYFFAGAILNRLLMTPLVRAIVKKVCFCLLERLPPVQSHQERSAV